MYKKYFYLFQAFILCIASVGCSTMNNKENYSKEQMQDVGSVLLEDKNNSQSVNIEKPSRVTILPEIDKINEEWINQFNLRSSELENFYSEQALLLPEREKYIKGRQAVSTYHLNKKEKVVIEAIHPVYRMQLSENQSMVYEIGYFTTNDVLVYQYLVIWNNNEGAWVRELEAVAELSSAADGDSGIDKARDKWIELANKHSAMDLAEGIYAEDFIYYNRGEVYEDYKTLAAVYSYMNNASYSVDLKKAICIQVKSDLAYEIGTWHAPGMNGNYIIIWCKQQNGEWKIKLDSNW